MRLNRLPLLGFFFLMGCHALNNKHDSLAVDCDINGKTADKVLLKFTNPGGIELTPEQVAQLQVQYRKASGEENIKPTSRACVALPKGEASVKAKIAGKIPLAGEIKLDKNATTGTVHTLNLEAPGTLDLGLKCPRNGFLASSSLENIIEVKQSLGKLTGYRVELGVYNSANEKILEIFRKKMGDESLSLPARFNINGLEEGNYRIELKVQDSYDDKQEAATQSRCALTVRRSCAHDEDFDAATVSCIPRLCDNAYRVGAKWTAPLAQQRGEGRYECRLVEGKATSSMLNHTCKAGYFKSSASCLAARNLFETCALLENDQVACWGTLPAKEMYPRPTLDYNFQETFQFENPVKDFALGCVRTLNNQVHCWSSDLGSNPPQYFLKTGLGTPKSWDEVIPPGFTLYRDACGIKNNGELWCFPNSDGSGGSQKRIPQKIIDHGGYCAIDINGKAWCTMGMVPRSPGLPAEPAVTYDGYQEVIGLPGLAVMTSGRQSTATQCVLLQDGKVVCWGSNEVGSVGSNDSASRVNFPAYVVDSSGQHLSQIVQIESYVDGNGGSSTCALNRSGQVSCWGSNQYGQLASGTAGEDDEGNVIFSRIAIKISVELKTPRLLLPPTP